MSNKCKENAGRKELPFRELQEGDQVWLRELERSNRGTLRKLEGRWNGPYVCARESPTTTGKCCYQEEGDHGFMLLLCERYYNKRKIGNGSPWLAIM